MEHEAVSRACRLVRVASPSAAYLLFISSFWYASRRAPAMRM